MKIAQLGRMLRLLGRKVWVVELAEDGAVGREFFINFLGRVRLLTERVLWQKALPDHLDLAGDVLLLVPCSWLLLKELSFPQLKPEQLAQVVPFELEEALPSKDVYTAWEPVPGLGNQVLAYAVLERTISPVLELLQKAGVRLLGIAPSSLAKVRALASAVDTSGRALLVSCGGEPEILEIVHGSLLYSSRGGEDLLGDLETFVTSRGKPERLIVAGNYPPSLIGKLRDAGFAPEEVPALPVAERALASYLKGELVDLAPLDLRRERFQREFAWGNYLILGFVAVVLCGFLSAQSRLYKDLKARHQEALAQIEKFKAQEEAPLPQDFSQRSDWLTTWALISQAAPEGVWLTELNMELAGQVQLKGYALSQDLVAELMSSLSSQRLGPVILNYSRRQEIGEREVTEFFILCGDK